MPIPTPEGAVVVRGAEAETIGHPAFIFSRLLLDASDTADGHLGVGWTRLAEGVDGARPHHHAHRSELFDVIDGEIEGARRRGVTSCPSRPAWHTPSARRRA